MLPNLEMIEILVFSIIFMSGSASDYDPQKHKNWKLLPHDICGQVETSRIIGGTEAPMNGYPWLAKIGYRSPKSRTLVFRCGGTVASSKVIVTAAHCVTGLETGVKVGIVRLGEHDTKTNPDCDGEFCADPVVDIAPSEILIHKKHNVPIYKHDIALIRLQKSIYFTAFIKPICFGNADILKKNYSGSLAEVAGWGIYDVDRAKTSTKLQVVKLPIVENAECRKFFPDFIQIGPTQMCVGGIIGKDSCSGDSGGPLMKVDDGTKGPRYFLLGIVSLGSKKCGKTEIPAVYTKMSEYVEWLLNNLEKKANDSIKVL